MISFNISKKTEFDYFFLDLFPLIPFILILLYFLMDPLSFNSLFSLVFPFLIVHQRYTPSLYKSPHPEDDCREEIDPEDIEYLNIIGSGSFSKVILAKDNSTGNKYALKIMKKNNVLEIYFYN